MTKSRSKLAVNTKKGKKAIKTEQDVMSRLCEMHSLVKLETPKNRPAPVDGVLGKLKGENATGICIYEFKSRSMSIDDYRDRGILISENKIICGSMCSNVLGMPFVIYFYFYEVDELWSIVVFNSHGDPVIELPEVKEIPTQVDTNNPNDKVLSKVYFLPVSEMKKQF